MFTFLKAYLGIIFIFSRVLKQIPVNHIFYGMRLDAATEGHKLAEGGAARLWARKQAKTWQEEHLKHGLQAKTQKNTILYLGKLLCSSACVFGLFFPIRTFDRNVFQRTCLRNTAKQRDLGQVPP